MDHLIWAATMSIGDVAFMKAILRHLQYFDVQDERNALECGQINCKEEKDK